MRCAGLARAAALAGAFAGALAEPGFSRADTAAVPAASVTASVTPAAPDGGPSPANSASDPEALRIASAGHSLKWNWTPPGHVDRYGHAETLIHAPLAAVRARVLDYQHYREILPSRFKISRVVGHVPDGSADVYIQIAVMHDMVLLWDVTRFAPVKRQAPDLEIVEGKMLPGKGNVEDFDVVWTMHALDPEWTVLKLDLLLKPNLPAPQSAVDEELRDSAMIAVDVIHDRSQGSARVGPWPG